MVWHEARVYALASEAGLAVPRWAWLDEVGGVFGADEPVVVKGVADGLLHKSELGAVRFVTRCEAADAANEMKTRVEAAGWSWRGALVVERVASAQTAGLPCEAFAAVAKRGGIWTVVLGLGGVRADALGAVVRPLLWPVDQVAPEVAARELGEHALGRVWLGRLRGAAPLTDEARLVDFVRALFRLAALARGEGLALVELNPVALDTGGTPTVLDGVAQEASGEDEGVRARPRGSGSGGLLDALARPRRVAVMGVSAARDRPGRVIIDNLIRSKIETIIVRPDSGETFLGRPCVPGVAALVAQPVDLLIAAVAAPEAVAALEDLIAAGGGAQVVGVVAGGLGDGADEGGLGERLRSVIAEARRAGRWAPAVLGPNFLGHVVPALGLDTTFIPPTRWSPAPRAGSLTLLSQSGALMLGRLAASRGLPLALALALGNQLDVDLGDVLEALADEPGRGAVMAYVEGFAPGQLARVASAVSRLSSVGRRVVLHRAGHSDAGRVAAAHHTGAIAGDLMVERAVLSRAGADLTDDLDVFEAAMRWLAHFPELAPGAVAVVSNAGFETVCGADLLRAPWGGAGFDAGERERLGAVLGGHGLGHLVTPSLPLDLTPMASFEAWREALEVVFATAARVVVLGLVPFTPRLAGGEVAAFADHVAERARVLGKTVGVVVDGGADYEGWRETFQTRGLPTFSGMSSALRGLLALGPSSGTMQT